VADAAGRRLHRGRRKFFEALGETLIAYAEVALDEERRKREPLPEFPEGMEDVWGHFVALHSQRDMGFGPERIKDRDVLAYQNVQQVKIRLWELDLIHRMDSIWYAAQVAKMDKATASRGGPAMRDEASVNDTSGIKRILKNLTARAGVNNIMPKKKTGPA
jgi:hypothetical protein